MSDALDKLASGAELTPAEWDEVQDRIDADTAARAALHRDIWGKVEDPLDKFRARVGANIPAPEGLPNCALRPQEVLDLLKDSNLEEKFKTAIRRVLEPMVRTGIPSMVTAAPISVGREDFVPTHMASFPLKNGKGGFEVHEYDPEEVVTEWSHPDDDSDPPTMIFGRVA